jgi:hypothetical protein
MHSVHHAAVRTQDDRVGTVYILNKAHVVDKPSDSWRRPKLKPEISVYIGDRVERHLSNRKVGAGSDEVVNVPGIQTVGTGSEVVLLTHSAILGLIIYPRQSNRP